MGLARPDVEELDDLLIHPFPVIDEGHLVDAGHILGGEDSGNLDIAEQGDLPLDLIGEEVLRPAQEDVRLDADLPKGLDAVLGGLRLDLARRPDERAPRSGG